MDSAAGHEASDDESDQKYQLDGTDTSKAEAALKAKLSRKRTKTGCLTCRKRRIKCGEERPMCKNCIKSKRHCETEDSEPKIAGISGPFALPQPGRQPRNHG